MYAIVSPATMANVQNITSRHRKNSPKDFRFEVMPVDRPVQPDESIEHQQVHPLHG